MNTAVVQLKAVLQEQPDNHAARLLMGRTMLDAGDAVGAVEEFRKVAQVKDHQAEALPLLASALLELNKPEAVIREFDGLEGQPPRVEAAVKTVLAEAYSASGKWPEAQRLLLEARALAPDEPRVLMLEARNLMAQRKLAEAQSKLDLVIKGDSNNVLAWVLQGDLRGFSPESRKSAVEAYQKAVKLNPNHLLANIGLIRMLMDMKNLDGAEKALKSFSEARSKHPTVIQLAAMIAFQKGQLDVAEVHARQLLKLVPENSQVLQLMGVIELRRGNALVASTYFGRVVSKLPTLEMPRLLLARSHFLMQEYPRALMVLKPLLAEKSPSTAVLALAGESFLQMGDPERAGQYLQRAREGNPTDAQIRTSLALTRIAKGDDELGLDELRKLSSSEPSVVADMALFTNLQARLDWAGAEKVLAGMEEKEKTSPTPSLLRGRMAMLQGEEVLARSAFEKAIKLDPKHLMATVNLAEIDVLQGQPANAVSRLESFAKTQPNLMLAQLSLIRARAAVGLSLNDQQVQFAEVVRRFPQEISPRLALIGVHVERNELGLALAAAQEALLVFPSQPEFLDALAQVHMRSGKPELADAALSKLLTHSPGSMIGLMRVAELRWSQKDEKGTVAALRKAIAADPSYVPALSGLVDVLLSRNRLADARQLLEAQLKERPAEPLLLALAADVDQAQGAWESAITRYRVVLEKRPHARIAIKLHRSLLEAKRKAEADQLVSQWTSQHPKDALFLAHLGNLALGGQQYEQARGHYEKALAISPRNLEVMNNLAWTLTRLEPAKGLELAQQVVRLAPTAAHQDTLAFALQVLGRHSEALPIQVEAVRQEPESTSFLIRLAKLQATTGDAGAAKATLARLKALGMPAKALASLQAELEPAKK